MFVSHGIGYITKRVAQLVLTKEDGGEILVTVDLVRDAEGAITGFKPKTKSAPELEYLAANKEAVVAELIKP